MDAEKAESSDEWSERVAGYRAARFGAHVDLPEFDPVFPTSALFRRAFFQLTIGLLCARCNYCAILR